MKVYIVSGCNSYGDHYVLGVYRSEEEAEAAAERERNYHRDSVDVCEWEVQE
ncbi:hypothetical protein N271_gp66 [Salmonella phage Jersey]|uniref:DUF7336 domain-containing protein n=1 Tax=Salmonella phage Jersey TaxID=1340534 RepID=S4X5B5_9CAUD|nr:hypothetical protein N271_gp66 [Salmonella phage Jersey]AGP24954.1 hypothetical protein Jersey_66 [Salmonella phage Jersey]